MGPDADDPELTLERFRERIRRHPGELKPLLRNSRFVAGIGNAYSDEILWEARLAPFRKRTTLSRTTSIASITPCAPSWPMRSSASATSSHRTSRRSTASS